MYQTLLTLGMLAGGLGLFMLAVSMITDGLKLAAGSALRDLLGKWTHSPLHGIATGITITALVQSSSAVTVATIGFVNAGLLSMFQALGVVYGANIGTTMTGWLVATIGFNFKIETFALPLIGVGMFLNLSGGDSRRAPLGLALAGFGLFFVGIDVLKDAFEGLAAAIDLKQFTIEGVGGVLICLGIGFLMTVLTQSSSAAIAITLSAASGGVLGLYAAAAMVIGANVGTTSTAAIAVIGATPNAKRVAAAHVVFNAVTGIVALLILPVLFYAVTHTGKLLGLQENPAVILAMFHTAFNLLGILLMWPLTNRLASNLEHRFVTTEESEGRPKFLDKTILLSPMLALHALALELSRITTITRRMALVALSVESGPTRQISMDFRIVEKLSHAVAEFVTRMAKESLTVEVSEQLTMVLRAQEHIVACADQVLEVARTHRKLKPIDDPVLAKDIANYRAEVVQLFKLANPEADDFSYSACKNQMNQIQLSYDQVKATLLQAGAELRTPIPGMIEIIEQNRRIRYAARQTVKAMRYLKGLYSVTDVKQVDSDETSADVEVENEPVDVDSTEDKAG